MLLKKITVSINLVRNRNSGGVKRLHLSSLARILIVDPGLVDWKLWSTVVKLTSSETRGNKKGSHKH